MGRPRATGRKDWPRGLFRNRPGGTFFTRHGEQRISLRTRDFEEACELLAELKAHWRRQAVEERRAWAEAGAQDDSLAGFARHWREDVLPTATRKNGRPMADKTRRDYERIARRLEDDSLAFPLPEATTEAGVVRLRGFLAQWLASPNYYN